MRLTARGIRNYQDKVVARQDQREKTIMELYGKGGSAALRKIFNSSNIDNRGINLFGKRKSSPDVDFSEIERDSLNPTNIFTEQDVSMSEQGYLKLLRKTYNISDGVAARLIANGDPTIFQRIYEAARESAKYYAGTLGVEPPDSIVANIVENSAIIPAGPNGKLDVDKVEAYIGREMDSVMKAMIQSEGIQRGQVILGDNFLREDVGPKKAAQYINSAVQYTVMFANNADKNISDQLQRFTLIEQPINQNKRSRPLTDDEEIQQDFLIKYQQQLQDAIKYHSDNRVDGAGDPLRLFQLYGISGLLAETERLPNLLNEPLIKKYVTNYAGEAGLDSRMVLRVPVFEGEERNVEAILMAGYKPSKVLDQDKSFLHKLLFGYKYIEDGIEKRIGKMLS
jgi:hypothetical protein